MKLDATCRAMLEGREGPARQLAMELVCRFGEAEGAEDCVPVTGTHTATAWYSGQSQLDFVEMLHGMAARVAVPSHLAASRVCLARPSLNRPGDVVGRSERLARLLGDMGFTASYTCAPYLAEHRPVKDECVAWSESSAVVFANSVLGARTNQGYDFIDVAIALCGHAPRAGLYLDHKRRADLIVDVSGLPEALRVAEPFYPVLGQYLGKACDGHVPLIVGLPEDVNEWRLRALGATASTVGAIRMFHVLGVTPEAPTVEAACQGRDAPVVAPTADELRRHRDVLSRGVTGDPIDAVCLGAPHIALEEFQVMRDVLAGRSVAAGVACSVSASRSVLAEVERRGWRDELEALGVVLVPDTCTYMGHVRAGQEGHVMTNSGKWAYYGPVGYGGRPVLGSFEECLESAVAGRVVRDDAFWSDDLW